MPLVGIVNSGCDAGWLVGCVAGLVVGVGPVVGGATGCVPVGTTSAPAKLPSKAPVSMNTGVVPVTKFFMGDVIAFSELNDWVN